MWPRCARLALSHVRAPVLHIVQGPAAPEEVTMTNLYVHVPLDISREAIPHCEAAFDWYASNAVGLTPSVRVELQNMRNEFRALEQQIAAGVREAVDLSIDPLLR